MKQLKDMDLNELKVLAYDLSINRQKLDNDLGIINNLILNKSQETPKKEEKVVESK